MAKIEKLTYLVGVDGGGSKTTALIARLDETVVGRGTAGSSNYRSEGVEKAWAALDEALRLAFLSANLEPDPARVAMAFFGLAGTDRPGDEAPFQAWLRRLWPGMPVRFTNDARLALAAGTPQGWGVAVVSGTGSIAYGGDPQGQMKRAGGWGPLLGDEGSGYDIGVTALRSVARAADGRGPQTLLSELLLGNWQLGSVYDLFDYVYRPQVTRTDIAALAALVEKAARQGDAVARGILQQAGRELALAAGVVIERLQLTGQVPCALVGGLLVRGELVALEFLASAGELGLQLSPVQRVSEPALGAIRLAKKVAG